MESGKNFFQTIHKTVNLKTVEAVEGIDVVKIGLLINSRRILLVFVYPLVFTLRSRTITKIDWLTIQQRLQKYEALISTTE